MPSAGYSATPLAKKLGIKQGSRVRTSNAPNHYLALLDPIPSSVVISNRLRTEIDLWHLFTVSRKQLQNQLPNLRNQIRQNGMIWVSWPKKASKVATDVTEDTIRKIALPLGLVDVKVCAVNEVWSGLKLVIRKELRT